MRRKTVRIATSALIGALLIVALAPVASAANRERGKNYFARTVTDAVFCGIEMTRQVSGFSNWQARFDDEGNLTYWHGTVNATIDITNTATDRTIRLRVAGIDKEVHYADGTTVYLGAGTGAWGTLPGHGVVSGDAGLRVAVEFNGELVSYHFYGHEAENTEMCAYLAAGA